MPPSRRQFSTKSLTILANDVTTHLPPNTLENFLATLSAIDDEIHLQLTRAREELSTTKTELDKERALRQVAESRLTTPAPLVTTTKLIPTETAHLHDATPAALIDLLLAREEAFRQQSALVDRLKAHNSQIRNAYQALSDRFAENRSPNSRINKSVHGMDSSYSTIESGGIKNNPRQSCGTDCCDAAAADLLKTIAVQQRAHEKLRATVAELTNELERIDPRKVRNVERSEEKLRVTERRLSAAEAKISEKDVEIAELKKQLKKVLAEYQAVSVAHSYSNAELSKIRANGRGKGKNERPTADRLHAFGAGVENLLHPRKINFR